EYAKKSRGEQFLYINNRYIKSYRLNTAVFQAYDRLIDQNAFPFFCLFIQMDPERMDINVHPTKQEIKLEDENFVYNIVLSAVKHALVQHSIPTLEFDENQPFELQPDSKSLTLKPSSSSGASW